MAKTIALAIRREDKHGKSRPWVVTATIEGDLPVEFGPLPSHNQAGILHDDLAFLLLKLGMRIDYVEEIS